MAQSRKARKAIKTEEIAKIVAADPGARAADIAAHMGIGQSTVSTYLAKPITRARIREILSNDGISGITQKTIGDILSALAAATADLIDAGIAEDADITKLLQLLQALVGTAERLARAGIDLASVVSAGDYDALDAEISRAYARGIRAGQKWPHAARRCADKLDPRSGESE